ACATAVPAPSPTPMPASPDSAPFLSPSPPTVPVDVPSGSCIFTLDVSNESSGSIYVQINDTRVATIPTQTTKRFMDHHGGLPEMPWHILLIRSSDGGTLGEGNFTYDQLDGQMTARDQATTANARKCAPA
ncbi:MAG: hypothetical protein ABI725_05570, partial [Chloroflexota bacterium]